MKIKKKFYFLFLSYAATRCIQEGKFEDWNEANDNTSQFTLPEL